MSEKRVWTEMSVEKFVSLNETLCQTSNTKQSDLTNYETVYNCVEYFSDSQLCSNENG